jgi:PAS domain S-box-containing protein
MNRDRIVDDKEAKLGEQARQLAETNRALEADVARRKRTEEELRLQSAALAAAANAIVITDNKGTIKSVNRAFTALTGYTEQEAIGQNHRILKSGRHDGAFYQELWGTISSGQIWSGVMINRRKDGSLYDEEMTITPVRDTDGCISHYIAIKQDITERKRAELEIQRQASFPRSNPNPVLELSATGEINYCNEATVVMARELGRETPARMLPPDTAATVRECLATGLPKLRVETKIGRRVISWSFFPVSFNNTVHCYAGDITERKRAEEVLRESEERFANAFEHAPMGMGLASLAGRWLQVNRALCNLLGYSEAELLARTFQDITQADDLEGSLENVRKLLAGEISSYHMEKHYLHASGSPLTVFLNVSLVRDGQGQPRYFIAQIQDLTEHKRLEAQLAQSQKMEMVGKLAGSIAHEFNSIMTAIIGESELLLQDLPPGEPAYKGAAGIRQAADRAASLTRQLLAYGRKQYLQPEIMDLNLLLADMDGMLRHLAGSGVNMRVIAAAGLKPVKADAGQIGRVIVNMVMNASDAMPNGGELVLETANVTLLEESAGGGPELKPGDYVKLAITDSGTGMSEEVKQHAFEPFYSTKGVGKGTGLGLATCQGIIEQSGGRIRVESKLGEGTTFQIFLPRAEPPSLG